MFRIIFIINICLAVVLILGGIIFWWPGFQNFMNLRADLERKTIQLKQKEDYYEKLRATYNELIQYQEQIKKIDIALPKEPSIAALLSFIQKASSENGLILGDIGLSSLGSFGKASGSANADKIVIPFSVAGSYPAFKNFLSTIYKNSRLIEVDSIKFSSPKDENDENDVFNFSITLSTNSFVEPAVQGVGASGQRPNMPGGEQDSLSR